MVSPGGPAAVRELDGLTIRKASVSEMDNNVYLLSCTSSGAQAARRRRGRAARLLALVQEGGGGLGPVVTTHQHWDHHRALAEVLAATRRRQRAGAADADALPVAPDVRVEQGDTVSSATSRWTCSTCAATRPARWRWSTEPSAGCTCSPATALPRRCRQRQQRPPRFASLSTTWEQVFDRYDDRTWFYPGHGADTTLGAERPSLPLWHERGW